MKALPQAFLFLALILQLACSGGSSTAQDQDTTPPTESAPSSDDISNAVKQAQQVIQDNSQLQEGEPLNFRKLQEFLPAELNDLQRTSTSGQTNGAMGFKFSQAEGKYETPKGEKIKIEVFDTGGLKMGLMSMAAWASLEMDREDENGYERTSTLKGHKAFEKFNKRSQKSELSLLINERFVIKATGQPLEMQALKAAVKELPLQKFQ